MYTRYYRLTIGNFRRLRRLTCELQHSIEGMDYVQTRLIGSIIGLLRKYRETRVADDY